MLNIRKYLNNLMTTRFFQVVCFPFQYYNYMISSINFRFLCVAIKYICFFNSSLNVTEFGIEKLKKKNFFFPFLSYNR